MTATSGEGVEVEDAGCCPCSRSANRWFSRSAAILLLISSSSLIVFGVFTDVEPPADDTTVVVVKEMPVGIGDLSSPRRKGAEEVEEISPASAVGAAGPNWVSAVAASMRLNSEDMVEGLQFPEMDAPSLLVQGLSSR